MRYHARKVHVHNREGRMNTAMRDRLIAANPDLLHDFGYRDDCGCVVWYAGGADLCWRHRIAEFVLSLIGRVMGWAA